MPPKFVPAVGSALLAAGFTVAAAASNEHEARHAVHVAAYYSTGDYGLSADTSIHYVPLSYEYSGNDWRMKVTAPYLKITGPAHVLINTGITGTSRWDGVEAQQHRSSAKGPGDILLNATYQLPALWDSGPFIDVGLEIKLPTADESRSLGTGAYDYAAQLDLFQSVGASTWFGTVGYKLRGSSIWFEDLRDSGFASLGLVRPWLDSTKTGQWNYGIIYDYREAASGLSTETHELLPFISWAPAPQWSLMAYGVRGFTRDSADYAVGMQLGHRW